MEEPVCGEAPVGDFHPELSTAHLMPRVPPAPSFAIGCCGFINCPRPRLPEVLFSLFLLSTLLAPTFFFFLQEHSCLIGSINISIVPFTVRRRGALFPSCQNSFLFSPKAEQLRISLFHARQRFLPGEAASLLWGEGSGLVACAACCSRLS